jgi:nucleotide-binding universal stress UspA family protein
MFDTVIVGVDGKPGGRDAVALASRLLASPGELTLAHVHAGALHAVHASVPGLTTDEREQSHELLQQEKAASGVTAQLVSSVSITPGRGLHDLAEEQQADLLVVGSSSHGLLGRALLKDDTRASLNGAPCAVAIASRGYAADPAPIATIGVGCDGSPESDAALATARALAQHTGASIRALEVVSIPAYAYTGIVPPEMGEGIEMMREQASARLAALPGVEGSAVYGLPGEELAALGDQVDLLVVGSRNYGPVRRLVLGSTSDYLAHHARCSLLVLPRMAGKGEPAQED